MTEEKPQDDQLKEEQELLEQIENEEKQEKEKAAASKGKRGSKREYVILYNTTHRPIQFARYGKVEKLGPAHKRLKTETFTIKPGLFAYPWSRFKNFEDVKRLKDLLSDHTVERFESVDQIMKCSKQKKRDMINDTYPFEPHRGRPGCGDIDLLDAMKSREKNDIVLKALQKQIALLESKQIPRNEKRKF